MRGKPEERRKLWCQRIAQQEKSGQSIRPFYQGRALREPAFHAWRQRLPSENGPVRFAVVETKPSAEGAALRIPADAATLWLVLSVLREQA